MRRIVSIAIRYFSQIAQTLSKYSSALCLSLAAHVYLGGLDRLPAVESLQSHIARVQVEANRDHLALF